MTRQDAVQGTAKRRDRNTGLAWAGAAAALLLSIAVRWLVVGSFTPVFSPDSASYTSFAFQWLADGHMPVIDQRPPGYPLFLVLTAGPAGLYARTVLAQQVLGIVSTLMLYWFLVRMTGRTWLAVAAVMVNVTLSDLLLMETVVYAETLAAVCVNVAAFALVIGFTTQRRRAPWLIASGVAWAAAAFVRPVYVVALVAFAALTGLWALRGGDAERRGRMAVFTAAAILPLLAVLALVVHNTSREPQRGIRFADGRGYSLLNYLAYPEMYTALPGEMTAVSEIYAHEARRVPGGYVWWWNTLPQIVTLRAEQGQAPASPDSVAFDIARRTITARPITFASIWLTTLGRFLFSYDLRHGLLIDNQLPPTPDNTQLSPGALRAARGLEQLWTVLTPLLSALALLLPLAAWRNSHAAAAAAALALWCIVVAVIVASVTLEPFTRQARYRIPLQHVLIALAAVGLSVNGPVSGRQRMGPLTDSVRGKREVTVERNEVRQSPEEDVHR